MEINGSQLPKENGELLKSPKSIRRGQLRRSQQYRVSKIFGPDLQRDATSLRELRSKPKQNAEAVVGTRNHRVWQLRTLIIKNYDNQQQEQYQEEQNINVNV